VRRAFPWSTLGIDADSDESAIRKAYATKLRAMDPDADHAKFDRLRAARDRALALARSRAAGVVEEDDEDDWFASDGDFDDGLGDGDASFVGEAPPPAPIHDDLDHVETVTTPATPDPVAAAQDALYRLLFDADPIDPLSPIEVAAAREHLTLILADPRMDEIDFAADSERWLSQIFAQSTPRSHPFVQQLADHFGWRAEAGSIAQPPSIAWLTERALAFDFRDRITQPSNKGYGAWVELTTPTDAKSKRGRAKHVRELIATIRSKHPVLEAELDWRRVTMWEGSGANAGKGWGSNAGWIIAAFIGLSALGRCADATSDPVLSNSPEIERLVDKAEFDSNIHRQQTISDVLRRFGGETANVEWLRRSGPVLLTELDAKLLELKDFRPNLEAAEPDIEQLIFRRIKGSVTTVPYTLLVTYRRSQSAVLKVMADADPADCPAFVRGTPVSGSVALDSAVDAYHRASMSMLLASRTAAPVDDGTIQFNALSTTIDDAAQAIGMTNAQWSAAFAGDASDRSLCLAHAAIIDAAIAAPRAESERVLKDL
jgi:hypothetical protein